LLRRIVQKVPHIVESESWSSGTGLHIDVLLLVNVRAELHGVLAEDFCGGVADVVGGLIENAGPWGTELNGGAIDVSELIDVIGRQPEWFLRVRVQLVEVPARDVEAHFIEECWRESMVPEKRARLIQTIGVPKIGCPRIAVEER